MLWEYHLGKGLFVKTFCMYGKHITLFKSIVFLQINIYLESKCGSLILAIIDNLF